MHAGPALVAASHASRLLHRTEFAPWVIKTGRPPHAQYLLGATRRLLSVRGVFEPAPDLIWERCPDDVRLDFYTSRGANGGDERPALTEAAITLADALSAIDHQGPWVAAEFSDAAAIVRSEGRQVELAVADREPLDVAHRCLMRRRPVLWIGDSEDGLHIGPLIATPDDARNYQSATMEWSDSRRLVELGFTGPWPLPLRRYIADDPSAIAEGVLLVLDLPGGSCYLVRERRVVRLSTGRYDTKSKRQSVEGFDTDEQRWAKGIFRQLQVAAVPERAGTHLGSCITPAADVGHLESNSAVGFEPESAKRRTMGEAAERFAAWRANDIAASSSEPRVGSESYRLRDFHPHGDFYRQYVEAGEPPIPMVHVRREGCSEVVSVPLCLIPFPDRSKARYTVGETSGLAAYPTRVGARLRAARELLERNNFYINFLHQRPGGLIDPVSLSFPSQARAAVRTVQSRGDLWLIHYKAESFGLPLVHAFILRDGVMSRGSGSGLTMTDAAGAAVAEAIQIGIQLTRPDPPYQQERYSGWRTSAVTDPIGNYLSGQDAACTWAADASSEDDQFEELVRACAASEHPVLSLDISHGPTPWHVYRVVVPGLTTSQWPSDSSGGQRVCDPVFSHGVPT